MFVIPSLLVYCTLSLSPFFDTKTFSVEIFILRQKLTLFLPCQKSSSSNVLQPNGVAVGRSPFLKED